MGGFAFIHHRCYLKANFSGTYYQFGVTSRIASSTLGQGCSSFGPVQQDRDLAGRLLEDWYAPTPDLCCASCSRKTECQGFAFSNSRCYLKGDVTGTYENTGSLVHLKESAEFSSTTPAPTTGTTLPPVDTPMCPDFSAEEADTAIEGCEGFAFFHHICYLKGNFSGTYTQAGVVTRLIKEVLPKPSSCPEYEPEAVDSDMSGDLITQQWAATSDDCCSVCQEFDECDGFVFFGQNCYLKRNFSGLYYHLGAVTRITSSVAGLGVFEPVLPDQDLAGDLLEELFAPTHEYCGASCARKPQCQGFTFVSSRCYLKGGVVGTFDNAGRITRVKRGVFQLPGGRRLSDSSIMV